MKKNPSECCKNKFHFLAELYTLAEQNLVRFAHNWNIGIMGLFVFHLFEKYQDS